MPLLQRSRRGVIDINAGLSESVRKLKSGKVKRKYKADWSADFLGADFSERSVRSATTPIVAAMAETWQEQVRSVTAMAAPGTRARRASAVRNSSSRWVKQRYGGGRIGYLEPNQTPRLFNDSGRLTKVTIRARQNSQGDPVFTMNVPANRLNPRDFQPGAFDAMVQDLRRRVPMLRGQFAGRAATRLQRAETQALNGLLVVAKEQRKNQVFAQRNRELLRLLRATKRLTGVVFG